MTIILLLLVLVGSICGLTLEVVGLWTHDLTLVLAGVLVTIATALGKRDLKRQGVM